MHCHHVLALLPALVLAIPAVRWLRSSTTIAGALSGLAGALLYHLTRSTPPAVDTLIVGMLVGAWAYTWASIPTTPTKRTNA